MNGRVFNINADMAACVIASQMKVRKLVFLSDVPGVLRNPEDQSSLISTIATMLALTSLLNFDRGA